jgi:hypothetical protein
MEREREREREYDGIRERGMKEREDVWKCVMSILYNIS